MKKDAIPRADTIHVFEVESGIVGRSGPENCSAHNNIRSRRADHGVYHVPGVKLDMRNRLNA